MGDFSKKFQDIMNDIEKNIKDEHELDYINKKITEISMLHLGVIEELADVIKNKMDVIEKKQDSIEKKIGKIESSVNGIENDMYENGFEFEIICPYCNNEFVADVESKSEIRCPECQNVIELDWNGGEEMHSCSGHCSGCSSKCGEGFLEEFGNDFDNGFENNFGIDDEDEDM